MALDPGFLFNALSGVLLIAIGLFVGSVKPRTRVNTLFAIFGTAYGLRFLGFNLSALAAADVGLTGPLLGLSIVGAGFAALVLPLLALEFPSRFPSAERRRLVLPALATVAVVAFLLFLLSLGDAANGSLQVIRNLGVTDPLLLDLVRIEGLFFVVAIGALLFFLFVLAVRFRLAAAEAGAPERRQLALVSAALGIYPAYIFGTVLPSAPAVSVAAIASVVLLVVYWLRNTMTSEGRDARTARNTALFLSAWPLFGLVAAVAIGPAASTSSGLPGVTRVLGEAVLAYAIVKHQLLGIDVKVRWGIKRGTVAGVFLAVFFVVSQVAQNTLSDYGTLLGGVAAGLLLFAIAPLQRAAERIADAAVPVSGRAPVAGRHPAAAPVAGQDRRDVYRRALRRYLVDGRLDEQEEIDLAHIAHGLGLDAVATVELRHEVARELGGRRP